MNLNKLGIFIILTLPLIAFNPFFWPPSWTQAIALKLIILVLFCILLYQILFKHKKFNFPHIKNNPIIWGFLLFFAVFFLASAFSIDPYLSFWGSPERGEGFINFLFYGLFSLLALLSIKENEWKKVWTFILGVGAIISSLSILSFYGFVPSLFSYLDPRQGATLGNPIPFGIYLAMLLFITISLFLSETNKKKKGFYVIVFIVFLFSLFLTGSRGAYVGFLAGVFYFLIAYPKQITPHSQKIIMGLRISALIVFLTVVSTVLYATYTPKAIPLISENRIAKIILPRLSLTFLAEEERFKTWGTVIEVIKEKPILGWGLENMSVGFDKHFDPQKTPLGWWDRSHNLFLDAAASAGILGFIAYAGLFIALFWQLKKIKSNASPNDTDNGNTLIAHGIQSTIIGYAVANLFSIDSFPTLLIFYLLAAYVISLANKNLPQENQKQKLWQFIQSLSVNKKRAFLLAFVVLAAIFAWQYNIRPFLLNTNLNTAKIMSQNNLCKEALEKIEKINLPQKILGQYAVLEVEEMLRTCIREEPGETLAYSKEGLEILEKSLPIYRNSSRLWILAGNIASTISAYEGNDAAKDSYLEKSFQYYNEALKLSPKSQEIILNMAWGDIIKKDCKAARERADQCIQLNPAEGACYWTRATSFICDKDISSAEKDIEKAKNLDFNSSYDSSVQQLINAYIAIEDYEKIAELYEFLVYKKDLYNVQWRASMAEAYRLSGQYEKARQAALQIIEVLPGTGLKAEEQEAIKKTIEAFLQTLPPAYR